MKKLCLIFSLFIFMAITNNVKAYNVYNVGDEIEYKGSTYYVIKNSSESDKYLTLVRDRVLSVEEIEPYGDFVHSAPGYANVIFTNCNIDDYYNKTYRCSSDYNVSFVRKTLESWANDTFVDGELIKVDGLKVRILDTDDLVSLGFEYNQNEDEYVYTSNKYDNIFLDNSGMNDVDSYFIDNLKDIFKGNQYKVLLYNLGSKKVQFGDFDISFIKPVINLKKEALGESPNPGEQNTDDEENITTVQKNDKVCKVEKKMVPVYKEYKIGDIITFNEERYLVIADSVSKDNYVTLLKINGLTDREISRFYNGGTNRDNEVGVVLFKENESAKACYNESTVKEIIDNWANRVIGQYDYVSAGLLDAKFLKNDLYHDTFGYSKWEGQGFRHDNDYDSWYYWHDGDPYEPEVSVPSWFSDQVLYVHSNITPSWFYNTGYDYWIDSSLSCTANQSEGHLMMARNGDVAEIAGQQAAVRPVLNVYQSSLEYGTDYQLHVGDAVTYYGMDFHVIEILGLSNGINIISLLKDTPLTQGEINLYKNDDTQAPGDIMAFNSNCSFYEGCTTDYETSEIKNVIDNWSDARFKDDELIEVDGYKARLITVDELINNLGYEYHDVITSIILEYSESTPPEVYSSGELFWTMSKYNDEENITISDSNNKDLIYIYNQKATPKNMYSKNKVRPVINLNKCVLEEGCHYEEVEVEVCDDLVDANVNKKDNPLSVLVGNTLNSPAFAIILMSMVLIISGSVIFIRAKLQSKKINKI